MGHPQMSARRLVELPAEPLIKRPTERLDTGRAPTYVRLPLG
jgi:hypothetical protein